MSGYNYSKFLNSSSGYNDTVDVDMGQFITTTINKLADLENSVAEGIDYIDTLNTNVVNTEYVKNKQESIFIHLEQEDINISANSLTLNGHDLISTEGNKTLDNTLSIVQQNFTNDQELITKKYVDSELTIQIDTINGLLQRIDALETSAGNVSNVDTIRSFAYIGVYGTPTFDSITPVTEGVTIMGTQASPLYAGGYNYQTSAQQSTNPYTLNAESYGNLTVSNNNSVQYNIQSNTAEVVFKIKAKVSFYLNIGELTLSPSMISLAVRVRFSETVLSTTTLYPVIYNFNNDPVDGTIKYVYEVDTVHRMDFVGQVTSVEIYIQGQNQTSKVRQITLVNGVFTGDTKVYDNYISVEVLKTSGLSIIA